MDSDSTKKWSMREAEDTIKLVFLMNRGRDGLSPKLRWTDIKQAIESQGRQIYPKLLTKALDSLIAKKEITVEKSEHDAREKLYAMVRPGRDQIIKLVSSMDTTRIQTGQGVGVVGEPGEGWTCYGVALPLKNRLRPRLRAEAKAFRQKLMAILDDEENEFLSELERKAKGRLSKADLSKGLKACALMFRAADEYSDVLTIYLIGQKIIEEFMPESMPMLEGMVAKIADVPRTIAKTLYGMTDEQYDKSLELSEQISADLSAVFEKLKRRDGQRLAERLFALVALKESLCVVVHL